MPLRSHCAWGVDTHAHVIPFEFPSFLGSAAPSGWPSMAPVDDCHRQVMIDAKNYRTISAAARHRPTEQARQFFYDTLVFDEATLKHLVHCFGDTQLMIGTDYPFNFHDDQPVARLEAA